MAAVERITVISNVCLCIESLGKLFGALTLGLAWTLGVVFATWTMNHELHHIFMECLGVGVVGVMMFSTDDIAYALPCVQRTLHEEEKMAVWKTSLLTFNHADVGKLWYQDTSLDVCKHLLLFLLKYSGSEVWPVFWFCLVLL